MKKTLIALAVAGAAVATGANASELYNQDGTSMTIGGRAEARMSIQDGDVSDASRVRVNFLGKQEITDSLYGLGFYEAEYTTNDESSTSSDQDTLDSRYIYAGLGGSFGQVTYGKQDGAFVAVTDFTDIMDAHGGNASQELAIAGDHIDNMLAYTGSFGDLSVNATYRFADRDDDPVSGDATSYDDNALDGYAVSGIYNFADTGLAFGLGFAQQHGKLGATAGDNDSSAMQYLAAVSYTQDALYLSAMYTNKNFDDTNNDYEGYEVAGQYTLDKTVFIATYNSGDKDDSTSKVNDLALEVAYMFKPNVKAYIDYDFNFVTGDEAANAVNGSEDEAMLGLRYDF
ncbi:porin [Vibrio salinus]|uniref:porin n=1 Tax=Vibrio salinus TaxID=2899784 RepID=UPI001E291326|nr:porin [Vibrio salinus]MCE0493336.1 porin [Vibrio salinus]